MYKDAAAILTQQEVCELRPPAHIRELIVELKMWEAARARKDLPNGSLRRAIAYLEEYQALCSRLRRRAL